MKTLRGVTWKHDRGLAPLLATANHFTQFHADVIIEWEARSLQEFGHASLLPFVQDFDLIVIDHTFVGIAARDRLLVSLDEHLPREVLKMQESESVGKSHQSYFYEGHQWALAIDAAAQVSAYRADLLQAAGMSVPQTWEEVIALAAVRRGFVSVPLLPVDALMCFFTLCANSGEEPFSLNPETVVIEDAGVQALERLKALMGRCAPECLEWNPIALWERMSAGDDIGYCPLAFGYSNYARPGYRRSTLLFADIPSCHNHVPKGSTLGGAGLAVTRSCRHLNIALEYLQWVAGADCQKSLYFRSGGQPGNRRAWTDPTVNQTSSNFFEATLSTLEQAFLRPRFDGYIDFQKAASSAVADFLKGKEQAKQTLQCLDNLYQKFR